MCRRDSINAEYGAVCAMGHLTLTLTLLSLSACLLGAASAPLGATTTTGMVSYSVPQATADAFGAKQLNGDAPIYELRRNSSSSKWVLFLEGGGWCFGNTTAATIASCASRAGFKPITAGTHELDTQPVTDTPDYGGVLGSDCSTNPGFCEWNAVFLHYRDGASFGSNRTDPIAVNFANGSSGAELWMRGRPSFDALVHDLQHSHGMAQATEVILSGGSAGGLAVLYNLDHLADLLGGAVRLTGFPDAGFFLDAPNTQGEFVYRANFQGADPVWNVTGARGTNEGCLAANTVEKWKCLMAPYIAMYLKTPIYVMNSAYDAYQLPNILQTPSPVSTVQPVSYTHLTLPTKRIV
eukprot:TRINITY_DN3688_c0_g1_i3.p1 TRINITY_DN3688_c0_g1~~TRINITY_DN3688_c0_g1_i3.p1  ORF type:complete len:352 (+),score=59.59 TRINITY_DN3688_c0_g1_i3:140-1195(+)